MQKYIPLLSAMLWAILQPTVAQGLEFRANATLGSDSNPYKLGDDMSGRSGVYLMAGMQARHRFNEQVSLQIDIKNREYERAFDDAQETRVGGELVYADRFSLYGKRSRYRLKVKYGYKDDTFVSRATGLVATAAGESLADRFDANKWGLSGKVSTRLTRHLATGLELQYLQKNYRDFNIAGLTDLDYSEFSVVNDWKYRWNRQHKTFMEFGARQRNYDNREEKDLAGITLPGTDLKYDYIEVGVGHKVKFTRHSRLGFKASYERRDDSGSGFYDKEAMKLAVDIDHRLRKGTRLDFEMSYQEKEFVAAVDPVLSESEEEGEPLNDRHGYTVAMGIEHDLTMHMEVQSVLYARASYSDISSDSPVFTYDRAQLEIGIKASW